MNKGTVWGGLRTGVAAGLAAGLVDALFAVAQSGGGLAGSSLAAFLISLSLWGMIGGLGTAAVGAVFPEAGGDAPARQKTTVISFCKKALFDFVLTVLFVSAAGLLAGRTAILVSGAKDFAGLAAGVAATAFVLSAAGIATWRQPPGRRTRFLRIAGFAGLGIVLIIIALDRGGTRAGKIDAGGGAPAGRPAPPAGSPSVLLIVMDTARADHVSLREGERETMPFLRRLAAESAVYERAVSPSPWTVPAHASLFTGQYAEVHQATFEHRTLRPELETMAELLRSAGYSTAAFSSNPNVSSLFHFDQGFDRFYEMFRLSGLWDARGLDPVENLKILKGLGAALGSPRKKRSDRAAAETQPWIARWLDSQNRRDKNRPFFIFVNYMPPHLPYNPPPAYRRRFLKNRPSPPVRKLMTDACYPEVWRLIAFPTLMRPADYGRLAELYDGELAFLDSCLERLIAMFRERDLLEETVVIITSDHGENLGEHGGLLNHSFSIHQTLLRVPLIVRYPRVFGKNKRYAGVVSTGSIFPTVLKLAGVSPADNWPSAFGLLPDAGPTAGIAPEEEAAVSEYELPLSELGALAELPGADASAFSLSQKAVQTDSWKLVSRSDGRSFLYNLAADPGEEIPLDPRSSPQGARLERLLEHWRAGLHIPHFSPEPPGPTADEKTRETLRSLGYLR